MNGCLKDLGTICTDKSNEEYECISLFSILEKNRFTTLRYPFYL